MKKLAILLLLTTILLAGCTAVLSTTGVGSKATFTQTSAITNTVIHPDSEEYDTQTLGLQDKFTSLLAGKSSPSDNGKLGDVLSCRTTDNQILAEVRRFDDENWWVVYDPNTGEYT